MRVLYRDACARRGGKCPYTFSFGNARSPMDEKADERLGRTCTQPPTPEAVRKEFSFAARSCVPPAPTLPGISYWGDAAAAFFGRMEREASSEPVAATDKVARGGFNVCSLYLRHGERFLVCRCRLVTSQGFEPRERMD